MKQPKYTAFPPLGIECTLFDDIKKGQTNIARGVMLAGYSKGDTVSMYRIVGAPGERSVDDCGAIYRKVKNVTASTETQGLADIEFEPESTGIDTNLFALALFATGFICAILGGLLHLAQDNRRDELCRAYGEYCPASVALAVSPTEWLRVKHSKNGRSAIISVAKDGPK